MITLEGSQQLNAELYQTILDKEKRIELLLRSCDELKLDNEHLAEYCLELREKLRESLAKAQELEDDKYERTD